MKVNEIFLSIQGESLSVGLPTVFVRFTRCNLRCSYCDTKYAYEEGEDMSVDDILNKIKEFGYKRVCLTGGEPLLPKDIQVLIDKLSDYEVSIETNGSIDLKDVVIGENHRFVMDIKLKSSGCYEKMNFNNFEYLNKNDEIKFVISNRTDYEMAKKVINKYYKMGNILMSPVFETIEYKSLVEWILEDKLNVRFQLQIHKIIWDKHKRGV